MIFWNGKWAPICAHYFTSNHFGASLFCQKLGYDSGVKTSFWVLKDRSYDEDSFWIGTCKERDKWPFCTGTCNLMNIGGECGNYRCTKDTQTRVTISCDGRENKTISSSSTGKYSNYTTRYDHEND